MVELKKKATGTGMTTNYVTSVDAQDDVEITQSQVSITGSAS